MLLEWTRSAKSCFVVLVHCVAWWSSSSSSSSTFSLFLSLLLAGLLYIRGGHQLYYSAVFIKIFGQDFRDEGWPTSRTIYIQYMCAQACMCVAACSSLYPSSVASKVTAAAQASRPGPCSRVREAGGQETIEKVNTFRPGCIFRIG